MKNFFLYLWNNKQKRWMFIAFNLFLCYAWVRCVMEGVWWFAAIFTALELLVFFFASFRNFKGKES